MPPSNYEQIANENIRRYGTDIDEFGPQLLSNRYSDRTHFIYELLQNAEDAIGWRLADGEKFPQDVAFVLQQDCLVFRHQGLPFSEEHVRGICSIGKGTKREDLTAIGKHGIGFKSVYAYTHHPEIHSGDEHFLIDSFVRPRTASARATTDRETLFYFPFDHPDVPRDRAYEEIHQRLSALDLKTLLFLRNVKSISWESACGGRGEYLRDSIVVADGIEKVSLLGEKQTAITPDEEQWLVFRKEVFHKSRSAGFVEVAFQLQENAESKKDEVARVRESPLVVFFPTEKETHLGFLLQGPYRTTPSRDNVPRDDDWNQHLVLCTQELAIDACRRLRDEGFLSLSAMESLIVEPAKYATGAQASMFGPIADAIVNALKTEEFIPRVGEGFLAGDNARLARAENLRGLFSAKQLTQLTGSKETVDWVSGDIIRTSRLRSFLVATIGIKELDAEALVQRFSEDFLSKQSDVWIKQLYEFLVDQQAIRRQYWFNSKPIIRLTDNSHVAPKGANGKPTAYLPSKDRTEFPTVKPSVCDSDLALKLLKDLDIKEPDPVDDVIHNIIPRYAKPSGAFPDEFDSDVERIVEAFQTDSSRRKAELIEHLAKASWIPCRNAASGEITLAKAHANTYLPTLKLQALFEGNSKVWFVDRTRPSMQGKKCQAVLEACGASEYLHRMPVSCDLTYYQLEDMRRQVGQVRATSSGTSDFGIDSISETLKVIAASGDGWEEKAFQLWDCIHDAIRHYREGFLYAEHWWSYSHDNRRLQFAAQFVRVLQNSRWLPGHDEGPASPSQVYFQRMPPRYLENANATFVALLQFKPDEIRLLAEKTGIDTAILDFIREKGITVEELRKSLGLTEETKPSPGAEAEEDESDESAEDANDSSPAQADDSEEDSDDTGGESATGNSATGGVGNSSSNGGGLSGGSTGGGSGSGSTGGSSGTRGTGTGTGAGTGSGAGRGGTGSSSGGKGHTANDREAIIKSLLRQLQEATSTGVTPDGEDDEHLKSERGKQDDEKYRNAVVQYEAMHQRIAKPKDDSEAGHDIDSFIREKGSFGLALVRRIEVKGKGTPWEEGEIVELSDRQFKDALVKRIDEPVKQHPEFDYWLYVVEQLADGAFRVLPLRNPSQRSAHYEFRGGTWRHLAEDPAILREDTEE